MTLVNRLGIIVLFFVLAPTARAELIKNRFFTGKAEMYIDAPGYIGGDNWPDIENWIHNNSNGTVAKFGVNGPGVPFANKYVFGPTDAGGQSFAFIENLTGTGSLRQSLPTLQANTTYQISWMAASKAGDTGTGRFAIGDDSTTLFNLSFTPTNTAFTTYSTTFVTPSSFLGTPFVQLQNDTTNSTMVLTGVSMISAVPEPSSLLLTSLLLSSTSVAYRFKNRKKSDTSPGQV